jgi:hypothetical protein
LALFLTERLTELRLALFLTERLALFLTERFAELRLAVDRFAAFFFAATYNSLKSLL